MKRKNSYLCAIDIGSSKLAGCVARISQERVVDLVYDTVPLRGVKRGTMIDSIGFIDALGRLVKNLRAKSELNVKTLSVNISGSDIITKHSKAIIPLAERGNKVITHADIDRVNDQARILGSSLEEEIIHRIPAGYTIDAKSSIANPLGLYSHRLEVDLFLVCARLSAVQTLGRAVQQAGFEVRNLFFSGIATGAIVFDKRLSEGTCVLCDIGSDVTEITLFKQGKVKDIRMLMRGGDDLTAQVSRQLHITHDLAEDVKRSHGSIGESTVIPADKEILIRQESVYKPLPQRRVCEILTGEARVMQEEIRQAVESMVPLNEINHCAVSGRTVFLDGFLESLEKGMGISVSLGRITHPHIAELAAHHDALSGHKFLTYLTALGIICQAMRKEHPLVLSDSAVPPSWFARAVGRVKEVYSEYF